MCELFGINSSVKFPANELLQSFYTHSVEHYDGWGLAVFHDSRASIEKEPVCANDSQYLKERLRHPIHAHNVIAHIRLASVGCVEYSNCHPFARRDSSGNQWVLAHNGTLFKSPLTDPYFYSQEGSTDSERILLYLIDQVDNKQLELGRPLNDDERFQIVDELVTVLSPNNKLNLLIHDGKTLYAHSNFANTLHMRTENGAVILATKPVDKKPWRDLPFTTLCAFRLGRLIRLGTNHGGEYVEKESDTKYLHLDSAAL